METPCQDGLFGDPGIGVCGPCMCAVGMHLSHVCNKTTGACYCNVSDTSSRECCVILRWCGVYCRNWLMRAQLAPF